MSADRDKLAGLAPAFSRRLVELLDACPHPVGITSGYRSPAEQQRLYDLWRAGKGNPANRPGTSRHEVGEAADLTGARGAAGAWYRGNAGRFGLRFPYAHEPWHVERDSTPEPPTTQQEDDDMQTAELYRDGTDLVAFSPVGRRRVENGPELTYWQASGRVAHKVHDLADDPRLAAAVALLPWTEPRR